MDPVSKISRTMKGDLPLSIQAIFMNISPKPHKIYKPSGSHSTGARKPTHDKGSMTETVSLIKIQKISCFLKKILEPVSALVFLNNVHIHFPLVLCSSGSTGSGWMWLLTTGYLL